MKDEYTKAVYDRSVQHIVDYCEKTRGAMMEINAALNRKTGKEFAYANVKRWLHKDPSQRGQPLFGVGRVLIEVSDKIIKASKAETKS